MEALQTENTTTTNGMTANSSSLNECVNLFFSIGAMRGKDTDKVITLFSKAFNENPRTAMRILFWSRDVREGAGERQIFRDVLNYLVKNYPQAVKVNLDLIPEYGRWDDLHGLFGTELENEAISLLVQGLKDCQKYKNILDNINNLTEEECSKIIHEIDTYRSDV
jgi:hypothetical protein